MSINGTEKKEHYSILQQHFSFEYIYIEETSFSEGKPQQQYFLCSDYKKGGPTSSLEAPDRS